MQKFIDELKSYGNSEIENHKPTVDKTLDQFTRMGKYLTDYGFKWGQMVTLMRTKKEEIIERAKNLGFDTTGLNEILDEVMFEVKKNFKEKYAPK